MKTMFVLAALALLGAGCAKPAAPPSASNGATAPALTTPASPAAASTPHDLTGAGITLSANYPARDKVFTNVVNGTVPAHWERGALHSMTGRLVQVNAEFDVSATQVTETFLMDARLGTGEFNGPVYTFRGAPKITGVTVNRQQSDPAVTPTAIFFTDDSISVNDSGITVTDGAKQVLDVTFAQ